jgi:hypothetical protein
MAGCILGQARARVVQTIVMLAFHFRSRQQGFVKSGSADHENIAGTPAVGPDRGFEIVGDHTGVIRAG